MKIKSILLSSILFCCTLAIPHTDAAEPGEGIVFDSATGNYTVSYFVELDDGSKLLQKTIFEPATQIDPSMHSKFRLEDANRIMYGYSMSNGSQSRQALDAIRFVFNSPIIGYQNMPNNISPATEAQVTLILDANTKALATPLGWGSGIFPSNTGGVRVSWNSINHMGIQPGNSVTGFGFTSADIPGLGIVEFEGLRKRRITYAGDGPQGDVKQQFSALRQKDFISRNAAVPTIAVPIPFDAAVLLDRIRTHVATWPSFKTTGYNGNAPPDKKIFLLDPAYAAQLDRYLLAAAEAYRLNNTKAGKEHIETLRKLLAKEHHNLDHDDEDNDDLEERKVVTRFSIDRLAARVLDFDLRYVLKRMEREEGEHKKK